MRHLSLKTILEDLHSASADIVASAVVSTDGITMASLLARGVNPDRVGGMSAALLALGFRATHELTGGDMKQIIVESENGFILLVQADKDSVLTLTAKEGAKLGMILVHARNAVKQIKSARAD